MAGPVSPEGLRAILSAASDEWRATPFYRLMLRGHDPDRVGQWGADPRLGDSARGREILSGVWRISSERLNGSFSVPWGAAPPSPHFSARLHSFSWLGDLASLGDEAQPRIAELIQTWASGFGEWHPQAWAPELTAERLYAWLCHGRAAFEAGDAAMRPLLLRSCARQARHLQLAAGDLRDPLARVKAGVALTLAGVAGLCEGERTLDSGIEILEEAAASQFLPDGGHATRAPEALIETLSDYLTADDALARKGHETPRLVREVMPKIAGMLRYLRLGDGRLACFHGGGAGQFGAVEALLARLDVEVRPFRIAPQSGYHRLAAGEVIVIMDAGAAPAPAFGERAHAGCLGLEMSCGADRLIVNVGSTRELAPEWRAAGRATNAHSTLIVDDALSAAFEQMRLSRGGARPIGPPGVSGKRTDDEHGARIDAQHEGYRADYGLVHRRTLFLDEEGTDLRGQDVLARPLAAGKASENLRIPFAIRFHLHPSVLVERLEPKVIRLETPSGAHWRLRTDAEAVQIDESIYLSERSGPQPARQIVMLGEADANGSGEHAPNRVRWALTRIDAVHG